MGNKLLIVNADDYGLSEGVNKGTEIAHLSGIVTSASLMVRAPAARSAGAASRELKSLDVGLHLDMGEWRYSDGEWIALYERAPLNDESKLRDELLRQIDLFVKLTGSPPTHIDSHQHAHRNEPLKSLVRRQGELLGIPVRHQNSVRYLGDFYGQNDEGASFRERVSADFLADLLSRLDDGITELCCHPAAVFDFEATYGDERLDEVEALSSDRVKQVIAQNGIQLTSFSRLTI